MRTYKLTGGRVYWIDGSERRELVLTPPLQINLLSQEKVELYEELRAGDSLLDTEAKKDGLCIHRIFFREARKDALIQKLKSLGIEAAQ